MAAIPGLNTPVGAPPPDIPSMPKAPPQLVDYLRRLNTWMNQQLQSKIPMSTAVPSIMLISSPGGLVWKLTVSDNGTFTAVQVPPGSSTPQ
jgi:hypothetical protein